MGNRDCRAEKRVILNKGKYILQRILNAFDINKKEAYECILSHGNEICLQLLEAEDKPFENVVNEILESKYKLLSDEFVIKDSNASKRIPFNNGAFVYFLYDDNCLVYIGKTSNLAARISTHVSKNTKIFNKVSYSEVNKSVIGITEDVNIYKYRPKYNKRIWSSVDFFKNVLKLCVFE